MCWADVAFFLQLGLQDMVLGQPALNICVWDWQAIKQTNKRDYNMFYLLGKHLCLFKCKLGCGKHLSMLKLLLHSNVLRLAGRGYNASYFHAKLCIAWDFKTTSCTLLRSFIYAGSLNRPAQSLEPAREFSRNTLVCMGKNASVWANA